MTPRQPRDPPGGVAHQRKLIRAAVKALLVDATAAGDRVRSTRVEPHRHTQLPAICIYTMTEQVDPVSVETAPRELTREMKLEIAGVVPHSEAAPADDAMDDLAEQIEAVMDRDPFLSGTVVESILESTEIAIRDEGDPLCGIVALTYAVTYRTNPAATAFDDFTKIHAETDITTAGPNTVPAVDDIAVQEAP